MMKKIILVIAAVALLASPAMAVDWNFYGSARMATWYNSRDFSNSDGESLNPGPPDLPSNFDDDDEIQWDLQGNSRIGANVKAENIRGQFEFAVSDSDVTTRRLYGIWDFGAGMLKVGQDYGPVTQFLSGQAFDGDDGLLGHGAAYGGREPQIELRFGGFKLALIQNQGSTISGLDTGDTDIYIPRIEASYGMSFDTWNFTLMGGYNYFEIADAGADEDDIDVDSWLLGGDVSFNFGPAYVKVGGSIGTNWSNAGWADSDAPTAAFNGKSNAKDVDLWQAMLAAGFKFTDQLTFEVGAGHIDIGPDLKDLDDSSRTDAYAQAVISMAPGVWLIPEVGYRWLEADYSGNGFHNGSQFYIGGKWQIDF